MLKEEEEEEEEEEGGGWVRGECGSDNPRSEPRVKSVSGGGASDCNAVAKKKHFGKVLQVMNLKTILLSLLCRNK